MAKATRLLMLKITTFSIQLGLTRAPLFTMSLILAFPYDISCNLERH